MDRFSSFPKIGRHYLVPQILSRLATGLTIFVEYPCCLTKKRIIDQLKELRIRNSAFTLILINNIPHMLAHF
jgi:hypothetical protein